MKEAYGVPIRFHKQNLKLIALCDSIVNEYRAGGYMMTVRQIYYQLVARGHIENTVRSYDNVQNLLTNARMAGMIDWDAIEDRTRAFSDRSHWTSGRDILYGAAQGYHEDLWLSQETRVFVVIEKEALAGVLERVCHEYDCPLLPARGYPSASTLREFAKTRIMGATRQIVVLHLGDHDPSGIDMSRDLAERLATFSRDTVDIDFKRIALNMDQVEELKPPPNPAKASDARFESYRAQFGEESWELDALPTQYLHKLVENAVLDYIDMDAWEQAHARITNVKAKLRKLADEYKD